MNDIVFFWKRLEFWRRCGGFSAVVSDPDDDAILQTAIVGHADILCTRDEAFRHEVVERVCTAHGIRILDDITLLR